MQGPTHPPIEALLSEQAWLQGLARSLAGDPHGAADLEQDTWLAALQQAPGTIQRARAWLSTVARRKAGREFVRSRSRGRQALEETDATVSSASDAAARAEQMGLLVQATLALPEPFRETVLLRYFEGLSNGEVAERMGVPASTVRSRLARAHDRLRDQLSGSMDREDFASLAGITLLQDAGIGRSWLQLLPLLGAAAGVGALMLGLRLLPEQAAPAGAGLLEPEQGLAAVEAPLEAANLPGLERQDRETPSAPAAPANRDLAVGSVQAPSTSWMGRPEP